MAQTPANLQYGVDDRPPLTQVLVLGTQFALLNAVYLIIIVIIVRAAGAPHDVARSAVSLGMIALAVATLLQALNRGPVGSGFLAPPVYSAIYLGPCVLAAESGGIPAVLAMTVFAGLVEIVMSGLLGRLRILMQPTVTGLIVCIVGLQLGLVGMQRSLDIAEIGKPDLLVHFTVSMVTLAVAIGLAAWGTGMFRLVCTLAGMVVGVIAAIFAGIIATGASGRISAMPWIDVPNMGYISFDFMPELMPAFIAAGIAASLRTVGVITTCQRANDADWVAPDFTNIRKGVLADGIGCAFGGLIGTPGMSVGPSLVGVSLVTGITSRIIALSSAGILFALAFVPRVSAAFLELPMSVAGPLLVFTSCLMITSGIQLMNSRFLGNRAVFVIGLGLLMALTSMVSHSFFEQLPRHIRPFTEGGLALSIGIAVILTLLFRINPKQRQSLGWKSTDELVDELRLLFRTRGRDWGLAPNVIKRCLTNAHDTLRLLGEEHVVNESVSVVAIREDTSLDIEFRYKGLPVTIPDLNSVVTDLTEESAATAGLSDASIGVFPDSSTTIVDGSDITLRLSFNG